MAAAIDGSLQIGFGFGKYTNRNVIDAYAGVSRGAEQWVVRASRSLDSDPDSVNVGPIHYEVIEPLQQIKVTLEANEVQPIAFELFFHATAACVVEDREDRRDMHGFRKATDQIRYHQSGLASGWLEVDGERVEIARESWVATRDKSWGIRPMVGLPAADLEPDYHQHIPQALAIWNPIVFLDDVGASYAFHHYYLQFSGPGFSHQRIQGGFEGDSGQREKVIGMTPQLRFDSPSKRLQEGEFLLHMEDGSDRNFFKQIRTHLAGAFLLSLFFFNEFFPRVDVRFFIHQLHSNRLCSFSHVLHQLLQVRNTQPPQRNLFELIKRDARETQCVFIIDSHLGENVHTLRRLVAVGIFFFAGAHVKFAPTPHLSRVVSFDFENAPLIDSHKALFVHVHGFFEPSFPLSRSFQPSDFDAGRNRLGDFFFQLGSAEYVSGPQSHGYSTKHLVDVFVCVSHRQKVHVCFLHNALL